MKNKYFIILLLSYFSSSYDATSQEVNSSINCGVSRQLTTSERQTQAQSFLKWKNENSGKIRKNQRESSQYTIPVVFHLIEEIQSISDAQLSALISSVNDGFANSYNNSLGADTEIEFCLAQKSPDGGLTSGVTRIISDYNNFDMDLENAKLKTMEQWDPRHYLNIWVVNHINSEILSSYSGRSWWNRVGAAGYATVPSAIITQGNFLDGIVISNLRPELLIHEAGHYLGLLHTFSDGCKNDDCLEDGDMVCDTPPDVSILPPCIDNSCATDTLSNFSNNTFFEDVDDMSTNYMDYSVCPEAFTFGQGERMAFHLDQFRINLFTESPSNNTACLSPCNANISIEFDQDDGHPLPNVPINFTSQSIGTTNYEWYVERLGETSSDYSVALKSGYTPSTAVVANSPDLTHSFASVGKYRVYVKAWNSISPSCFTSYSKIVKVSCGVDARFWPDIRFEAAKQPDSLFLEPVTFTNRSFGAETYEWTITHTNLVSGQPSLPMFNSTDTTLVYTFSEPGDYKISLLAINGTCEDTSNTFNLRVVDPTIDGVPSLLQVDCYNNDSVRVSLRMYNHGYDTINVGTPISFYDADPQISSPNLLKTFLLPEIVYGFDSADYTLFVKTNQTELDQIYVVFNDFGSNSFPINFPPNDLNVFSFNTIHPPSGYAELAYENNYDSLIVSQYQEALAPDILACLDEEIELVADSIWESVIWESVLRGELGTTHSLSYVVDQADTINMTLKSTLGCDFNDSFLINISTPEIQLNGEIFRILKGSSVQLIASGGVTYEWSPQQGLDNHLIANPVASPEISTLYTVEMTDSTGCKTTGTVQIIVESNAFIPNLFTPNEDQRNDLLKIYGLQEVDNFTFKIFNRTGSLVFESSDMNEVSNSGWDGTKNGKIQPNGVYYWKISGTYLNGKTVSLNGESTGAVHLLR